MEIRGNHPPVYQKLGRTRESLYFCYYQEDGFWTWQLERTIKTDSAEANRWEIIARGEKYERLEECKQAIELVMRSGKSPILPCESS